MSSIYSKIIAREIPAYIVAEDAAHIAFLDINPVALGHVLVVPKIEVDYLFDLENDSYQALWVFTKQVASGLKRAVPCQKIGVSVIGIEVPHAHIHLVPLNALADINFSKPKLHPETAVLVDLCNQIAAEIKPELIR